MMLKRSGKISSILMMLAFGCGLQVATAGQVIPLQLPEGKPGPYYAARMPQTVFAVSRDSQLSDLKIRNAKGDYLAYAWLDQVFDNTQMDKDVQAQALPIFPLYPDAKASADQVLRDSAINLQVQRQTDGSLQAKIQAQAGTTLANKMPPTAWIIDASKLASNASLLQATLGIDNNFDGIAGLQMYASDDLQHWRNIASRSQIVQLTHAGQQIQQLNISLANTRAKYLRLNWEQAATAPKLLQFEVTSHVYGDITPSLDWSPSIAPEKCDASACTYRLPLHTPADSLRIRLAEKNTLAAMQIFGQVAGSEENYQRHHHFRNPLYALHLLRHHKQIVANNQAHDVYLGSLNAYRLALPQGEVETADFALNGYPYETIRLTFNVQQIGKTPPTIHIASMSKNLVFLARGEAPFHIEFDGPQHEGGAQNISTLMPSVNIKDMSLHFAEIDTSALPPANVAPPPSTNNAVPVQDANANQKRYWLMATLAIAILIIAAMVWSSFKKIGKDSEGNT